MPVKDRESEEDLYSSPAHGRVQFHILKRTCIKEKNNHVGWDLRSCVHPVEKEGIRILLESNSMGPSWLPRVEHIGWNDRIGTRDQSWGDVLTVDEVDPAQGYPAFAGF